MFVEFTVTLTDTTTVRAPRLWIFLSSLQEFFSATSRPFGVLRKGKEHIIRDAALRAHRESRDKRSRGTLSRAADAGSSSRQNINTRSETSNAPYRVTDRA